MGKPQELAFKFCQILYERTPYLLASAKVRVIFFIIKICLLFKESIYNAFLIAEKLIGPQDLSLRGVEFIFSRDFRLIDGENF